MRALKIALLCLVAFQTQAQLSGTLKPRLFVAGRDTSFLFTKVQVKELAKLVTIGEFDRLDNSLQGKQLKALNNQVELQRSIIVLREKELRLTTEKVTERDFLIVRYEQEIALQRVDLLRSEKLLRRERRKTKLAGAMGIVGIIIAFIL